MLENPLSIVELSLNPDPRVACVLLLDTSGSMSGQGKIGALNSGLRQFKAAIAEDEVAKRRVEICIVEFNDSARLISDFVTPDNFTPPTLTAGGTTAMGEAVLMGLDIIRQRKEVYKHNGLSYYRPWIFLLTDGAPTDEITYAAQAAQQSEATKEVIFFAVGVGADANRQVLKQLAPNRAFMIDHLKFEELFRWLSNSVNLEANSRGGQLRVEQHPGLWI